MAKAFIIMGSKSDFEVASKAIKVLKKFGVDFDIAVSSAHRTPERTQTLVTNSDADVFIAIAGLSAALPGVIASFTTKPVIGVPVKGDLNYDALLSIVQMPPGIPVACVGLGRADNAATLAAEIMALKDPALGKKLQEDRLAQAEKVSKDSVSVVEEAKKVE
ncbi:5-(carboxyamino)imidazole ribonucleotide mutase [Thermoplasmatales archaeon BRNA1]|nr:5-(carboxyamino)imidazole ribonucleotide mutase [Thermoplasmatales archaeon BRNA1]